jgi:hypothetical protein
VTISPNLLIWDNAGPQGNMEALAGFREALALSVVPYSWARGHTYGRKHQVLYSNRFSIYPWIIDKNYEYVVMHSSAMLALQETKSLPIPAFRRSSWIRWHRSDLASGAIGALGTEILGSTPEWNPLRPEG